MKIVHTNSGQAYQLKPGAQLEVERTNLFFNEYGEQTLPIELPDTDVNRMLTGYAHMGNVKNKPLNNIAVTIQEGDYFMPCRQVVLRAKRKEGINTSFYMNEGSFLSQVENISLREMFGTETVPGVTTVAQGIAFCKSLLAGTHTDYACFPALIDFDGERKYLNRVEWMNAQGSYAMPARPGSTAGYTMGFYNEFQRVETSGEVSVLLDPGYYITPFIRARYLLRRIFAHFGYTLATNFFDTVQPFKDMVFINNTMDSLVNNTILLAHLVPDCMCGVILNVFRKKFNCEFVADEVTKVVTVKFFNDIVASPAAVDLTNCLTAPLDFDYSNEWRRIKLSSESVQDEGSSFDSVAEMLLKFPEAWRQDKDGAYYHTGYGSNVSVEKVAGSTLPYSTGGPLDEVEVTVPDCALSMVQEEEGTSWLVEGDRPYTEYRYRERMFFPYIGDANALNSTLDVGTTTTEESDTTELVNKDHTQDPALCFAFVDSKYLFTCGTTTSHDNRSVKLWDYSLHYNGQYGIFEKFYRPMDLLYRNSLVPVEAQLLLSNTQKQSIAAHEKVIISGQEFLIDKLAYTLGGKNDPKESQLLTTQLYEPLSAAPLESEVLPTPAYMWVNKVSYDGTPLTPAQYEALLIKNNSLPYIYPSPPTAEQYAAGGHYYERIYYYKYVDRMDNNTYYRPVSVWLEAALYSAVTYYPYTRA
jgi:hypothetical protein